MAGKYRRHQSSAARRGRKGGRGTTHNLHGGVGHHYYTAEMQRKKENGREEQQEVTEKLPGPSNWFTRLCLLVLSSPWLRALFFTFVVSCCAAFSTEDSLHHFRDSVPTARHGNPFNRWLVKLAWGWTVAVGAPVAAAAGAAMGGGWRGVAAAAIRSGGFGSAVWFGFTKGFDAARANLWPGFDISGHCFLLAWCTLFLIEEAAPFHYWDDCLSSPSPSSLLLRLTLPSRLLLLPPAAALALAWDVMFASTALFYHTAAEKAAATAAAIAAWFLLYRVLYPAMGGVWSPRRMAAKAAMLVQ